MIVAYRGEIVSGIERPVTQKLERTSVNSIGSRFRNDVNLPARIVAVLGVEIVGHDAKLGDGVKVWNNPSSGKGEFLHRGSVQQETIGRFTLAIDRQIPSIQIARNVGKGEAGGAELSALATREARRSWGHTGL